MEVEPSPPSNGHPARREGLTERSEKARTGRMYERRRAAVRKRGGKET